MGITLDELTEIKITDGTDTLAINGDGSLNATVSATNLDIRDLVNTQDSIAIGDETNIVDMQQMDSAFGATSYGFPIFGIRRDASGSPVSATGDAHPFVFNNDGELKVAADLSSDVADDAVDTGNPVKVGGYAYTQATALTALSAAGDRFNLAGDLYRRLYTNDAYNVAIQATAGSVTSTAAEFLASPLAGRKHVTINNNSEKTVYLGHSAGVTTANGVPIGKNATASYEFGESIDIYLIVATGTADVRFLEAA